MTTKARPILAVTMGDPAGTGPELIAKAFAGSEVQAVCRPVVIGYANVLHAAAEITGGRPVRVVATPEEADGGETLDVIDLANVQPGSFTRGEVSAHAGSAAYDYI